MAGRAEENTPSAAEHARSREEGARSGGERTRYRGERAHSVDERVEERSSQRLLIALGVLWLLLAAAIIVSQLSAPPPVRIEWETETEVNTVGFNIYRREGDEGAFVQLNEELIPSKGSPVSGASYLFVDEAVVSGQTYYYQLEDVEFDNTRERHEVFQYTTQIEWWIPITAAFSILCGIFLLIKGLR